MRSALEILQEYWHFSTFRGEQENIIRAVLNKKDVLALLPTGGGKSICFQVPAMMREGLCIVITPLIALMKDQVENLISKNISACAIHSGLTNEEVLDAFENAQNGKYKFLYLSPERLDTAAFLNTCESLQVNLIAVDEAHCISQWGYDFRPAYLEIAKLRAVFTDVPILALTASATPEVQKDICDKLLFRNHEIVRSSFQRKNVAFQTFWCDNKLNKLAKILNEQSGSAIVYCKSRRLTQDVSRLLNVKNISADFYHAGLTQEIRDAKQNNWMNDKVRVIVCTNAFGMGIDKPNVRCVVHYDAPNCLENYYQEAGRAGRDGNLSQAVLLYREEDLNELRLLPEVRFPKFSEIKKIYQSVCDYLQIPVGLGEGTFYDFDFNTFLKNFKLNALDAMYAIKALEQAGFISFNESIFLPSKITFTIDKESLYDFENYYPQYEPIIKCLLRNYDGIAFYRVSVYEKQIARLINLPEETIMQQLHSLHQRGVIEYLPKKDTPQMFFLTNRAPIDFLFFDHESYLKRKKIFTVRIEKMLEYIYTKECRSKFIAAYFGEEDARDCGICDNCTKEIDEKLSAEDFTKISSAILKKFKEQPSFTQQELILALSDFSSKKVKETLRFMQREQKIKTDLTGKISKN